LKLASSFLLDVQSVDLYQELVFASLDFACPELQYESLGLWTMSIAQSSKQLNTTARKLDLFLRDSKAYVSSFPHLKTEQTKIQKFYVF
jgi:hypothetical protein